MRKTSLNIIAAVLICLLFTSLAACGEKSVGIIGGADGPTSILVSDTNGEATLIGEGKYTFNFTATFADGTSSVYTVSTDEETVGSALQNLGLVEGENSAYGLYVKRVCGVLADYDVDATYWALYVNGESSMVGVDGVKCADAESVEFRLVK